MRPLDLIKSFARNDSGAVTVDWVVLTAAIVGLGIAVITAISSGVGGLGGSTERTLSGITIAPIDLDGLHAGGSSGGDDDEG
jgi:hypothetical protein